jgi:xylulokinase
VPLDCGIDIGTTNLKVVLIDGDGRAVAGRSIPTPRLFDGVGPVTDATALVCLLEELIIDAWRDHGRGQPLRSITAAGIGEDGIGIGADLRPTGLAIPWFDRRAEPMIAALRALGDRSHRTGIAIASDRTVAKWAWLREHRPHDLDEAAFWVALADYPAVWWSGKPFMSLSLAPRTACFDILRRDWEEPLLEAVGAPRLPAVMAAGTALGSVRNGPLLQSGCATAGTIVAVGGHDHPVAASVFMRNAPNGIVDSLGTANLLYGELDPRDRLPDRNGLALSLPPAGGDRLACLGVIELASALALEQQDEAAFRSFLAHPRLPGDPPGDIGALAERGSGPSASRRSLERVTLEARALLAAMQRAGVDGAQMYTSGGWSRSRGFIELRASIFGRPIHAVDALEMTAIGAALFGAMAAGGDVPNTLGAADITTIDPVTDWVRRYDALFPVFLAASSPAAAAG